MLTDTGTNEYKSPEMVLGAPYNPKIDIWSLGVTIYYALTGQKPFKSKYIDSLYKKIAEADVKFKGNIWKEISKEAKTFINGCLNKYPFLRMDPEKGLNHGWINDKRFIPSLIEIDISNCKEASSSLDKDIDSEESISPSKSPFRRATTSSRLPITNLKKL
mmetsp:Transcript_37771/g.33794  ORF Transcript_37771/g.33794 Transcript_37771/m.33794 type:complete len:161 (+) Transcript_37771:776-1258(+)